MNGGIGIKTLTALLVTFLILLFISGIGAAAEIIVQPGSSIQKAVNNSSSGDVITVKPGTYTENINVTKDNLTIQSESGNPDDTIINVKRSGVNVFLLQGSNIKITGFKVMGARSGYAGIRLSSCSNCIIENNKLLNNCYGIYVLYSKGNKFSKNTATNNTDFGIALGTATDNTLSGNTAFSNGRGIHFGNSDGNTLLGNTIRDNTVYGFSMCPRCDTNQIYNNYFNDTITITNGIGNILNIKKTAGTNIVGGPYMGGNFWGKPDGTGFSNTAVDKDSDGISDSAYKNITGSIYSDNFPLVVYKKIKPVAAFSATPTSGNAPLNVTFTDSSTGSPTAWKWTFGDGTNSEIQNPVHEYSKAGNYTVALTASNDAGSNTTTKTGYIYVGTTPTKPVANFSAKPTSGKAPLNVTFTDTSTGTPTKWKWSFGDGTSSTLQNPTHKYSKAGNYTVVLTVSNAAGNSTKTKSNYIKVSGTFQAPVAVFFATPTSGTAPLNVTFTDSSTGSPTAWKWTFGDGTNSAIQNPVHEYSKAGNYTVALTVSNSAGSNTLTKTGYINVGTPPTKLVADFEGSPLSGKAPLSVKFTDKSTGTPTKWKWSFGDGTSSTQQNPTHKYSKTGRYTVTLTATNAAGSNTATKSNYITVTATSQTPVAAFSASPTSGKTQLNVAFTDKSTGSPTSWKWTFGDGTSSTTKNPTHKYSAVGKYTVTLTASNAAGSNTKTISNYITVTGTSQTPTADFWGTPLSGKAPLKVTFTETSKGSPTSWKWDFGDGTSSTKKSPTHTYSAAGTYTVKLTATNAAGSSTKTKSKYIKVTK